MGNFQRKISTALFSCVFLSPVFELPAFAAVDQEKNATDPDVKDNSENSKKYDSSKQYPFPVDPASDPRMDEAVGKNDLIHFFRLASVPLVQQPVDLNQDSAPIWVKGPRPKNNSLAKVDYTALEEVTISVGSDQDGQTKRDVRLVKAKLKKYRAKSEKAPESLKKTGAIFCGNKLRSPTDFNIYCLEDVDLDSSFDHIMGARGDGALILGFDLATPFQVSVLGERVNLVTPVKYAKIADADKTRITAEYINCAKDWDRPRFRVSIKTPSLQESFGIEGSGKLSSLPFSIRMGGGSCEKAVRLESPDLLAAHNVPKKGVLVEMNNLYFSVSSKKSGAAAKLVDARRTPISYRVEGESLVSVSRGLSQNQIDVATRQLFDQDTFQADGHFELAEGDVGPGGMLMEIGFKYGYVGQLSEKSKIRTLLSSRSLDAGTLLYGLPMRSSRQTVYGGAGSYSSPLGGIPIGPRRDVSTRLVWCTPVSREKTVAVRGADAKVRDVKETVWSATCMPDQDGRYTILKDQSPPLLVQGFSYSAGTSTTGGAVPVKRLESQSFGKRLRLRYLVEAVSDVELKLLRQDMIDDEVTYEMPQILKWKDGAAEIKTGGAKIIFTRSADDLEKVAARQIEPAEPGMPIDTNFNFRRRYFR